MLLDIFWVLPSCIIGILGAVLVYPNLFFCQKNVQILSKKGFKTCYNV